MDAICILLVRYLWVGDTGLLIQSRHQLGWVEILVASNLDDPWIFDNRSVSLPLLWLLAYWNVAIALDEQSVIYDVVVTTVWKITSMN